MPGDEPRLRWETEDRSATLYWRPGHDHEIRQPVRRTYRYRQCRVWRDAGQRPAVLRTSELATVFDKAQAMAQLMDRVGLQRILDGRAPFPARRLRVHPQCADDGGAPRPCDQAAEHRLRLQHRPDVASAAARRGFRHGRHPDRRARDLRRRARLSYARGRDLRLTAARPAGQPRALRRAGRHHLQGVQQRVVLASGQALHAAAGGALSRLHPQGTDPGAAPVAAPGRMLAAHSRRHGAGAWISWPSTASRA